MFGFTENRASGSNFIRLTAADSDHPIAGELCKWSDVTAVSVEDAGKCLAIKTTNSAI